MMNHPLVPRIPREGPTPGQAVAGGVNLEPIRLREEKDMLIVYESDRPLREVCDAMEPVVQKHKFGIVATHDLREMMARKGVPFDGACVVFEICNPTQAKRVLDAKPAASAMLPCRVSVYREAGKTKIATLRPTALVSLLGAPDLEPVAGEVEEVITSIMRDVA